MPTLASLTRGGLLRIHARGADEGDEWVQVSSSQVGTADSTCLDVSEDGETLRAAVGGRGAELRVLDALQGAESYRARGGRAHPQTGLMDPAWVSACAFVPGTECRKVVVGTGHYKLRLYDLDHGRRPRIEVPWEDARVTALGMSPDGQVRGRAVGMSPDGQVSGRALCARWRGGDAASRCAVARGWRRGVMCEVPRLQVCWVANGKGMVSRWDLTSGTVAVVLKGIAGSVRSVAVHPTLPLVATVGLDRFLRVHHLHTLKPLVRGCRSRLRLPGSTPHHFQPLCATEPHMYLLYDVPWMVLVTPTPAAAPAYHCAAFGTRSLSST